MAIFRATFLKILFYGKKLHTRTHTKSQFRNLRKFIKIIQKFLLHTVKKKHFKSFFVQGNRFFNVKRLWLAKKLYKRRRSEPAKKLNRSKWSLDGMDVQKSQNPHTHVCCKFFLSFNVSFFFFCYYIRSFTFIFAKNYIPL